MQVMWKSDVNQERDKGDSGGEEDDKRGRDRCQEEDTVKMKEWKEEGKEGKMKR